MYLHQKKNCLEISLHTYNVFTNRFLIEHQMRFKFQDFRIPGFKFQEYELEILNLFNTIINEREIVNAQYGMSATCCKKYPVGCA